MIKLKLITILSLFLLFGCKTKTKVDAIYYNGKVVTVDSTFSMAEAFAVKDGKFVAVGKTEDLLKEYDANTKIDLQQKFVYPGFIDAHCHFMGYAADLYKCQLTGTKSFEEILEKIKAYDTEKHPDFIYGRGWDQNDWSKTDFPNNDELNKLFPDKPVFLKRIDGHAVLVNEKFLQLANDLLKPYLNSVFVEQKNGKLTGILFDNAMDAVEKLIPPLSKEEMTIEIMKAQEDCIKLGLTSLSDAGLSPEQIMMIDSLQKLQQLKLRIYAMISATDANLQYFDVKGKIKTPYLNVQSLKAYADGALGSRGAKLKTDYSDKAHHNGALNVSMEDLHKYALWALQHNFQLNTHAIGDSGVAFVLQCYKELLTDTNDLRWRIEHAQVVDLNDMGIFGQYHIVPSVQPTHATSDMPWAASRLGSERIKGAYAYQTLLKQNGWMPLGTDFPVEYLNPQYTFYAAVSRRDANGNPPSGFQNNEALTREEALKGMTIWAAKSGFEEKEKGSIEMGKYADFLIYEENFLKDDLLKIRNSVPLKTFINGMEVFNKQ